MNNEKGRLGFLVKGGKSGSTAAMVIDEARDKSVCMLTHGESSNRATILAGKGDALFGINGPLESAWYAVANRFLVRSGAIGPKGNRVETVRVPEE